MRFAVAYTASPARYDAGMPYRRCGQSGLKVPMISLGLWQNFGADVYETGRAILRRAFDRGITHFDLANNYGPPYGSAEETLGRMLDSDFRPHRDELLISTKAGWDMRPGPYGIGGSRKHLVASLDQSLKRQGLDYVDIYYSHRPGPEMPLEETVWALAHLHRQGKALHVGISSYSAEQTRQAWSMLENESVPLLGYQPAYSLLNRSIEDQLLDTLRELDVGCIVFSPLAHGALTGKYLGGPENARGAWNPAMASRFLMPENLERIGRLGKIARRRGQSLAQMAIARVLRDPRVTSALVGARTVEQLDDCLDALRCLDFSSEELGEIDKSL